VGYVSYKRNRLYCEDVPVAKAAGQAGTPLYLYSQTEIETKFRDFDKAFEGLPHLTCYAAKANSNLAILTLLRTLGSGFDIVSGGELRRVIRAGAKPDRIVFSGVGKTQEEIDLALQLNILQFNVESEAELSILEARARSAGRVASFALRVNPNVQAGTHPYISTGLRQHKFGVPVDAAVELCRKARRSRHLKLSGIGCHIGSQITRMQPFVEAVNALKDTVTALRSMNLEIRRLDLGGGLGITYNDELPPHPREYGKAVREAVEDLGCTIILEPGRVIVGSAGILVTRVVLTKANGSKHFVVVDAAMNDLMRPSLYGSFHAIQPENISARRRWTADVVGPICESGDFLARDREMPVVKPGDLLAIAGAGAYGFALSSNYNSRPRAAEVLIRGSQLKVIRRRETFNDLIRGESATPL
jgi:diaminopimelate decarboxylase